MKLDKNYKVRVTPEQSREIHSLILLEGGEVSYGLKPQLQDEFLVVENEHDSVVIYYTDQDIFPTTENQEIQADDLIALLTDLLKSAENPLQDMKLTPELEAVEPKFKVGDKVYIPNIKNICTIREGGKVITSNGQYYCDLSDSYDLCFVLATPENHALLSKLYPHIEFEQPAKELKGSDTQSRKPYDTGRPKISIGVNNMNYQAPKIEWQEPKNNEVIYDNNYQNNVICFWHNPINSYFIRKNPDEKSPKPFVVAYGGRELKEMASVADAKEWVEQIHYPSALRKAGFKPVDKEVLKPNVYRLDYFDGEYSGDLVHSYDRSELEKLIADATEYHKTIKDLDFDDDEAVDAWLEKHPLNDFNGDQIDDLLDIDDYEPLSGYLSIYSFEVSGVSE